MNGRPRRWWQDWDPIMLLVGLLLVVLVPAFLVCIYLGVLAL